jgi:hypothetical protein
MTLGTVICKLKMFHGAMENMCWLGFAADVIRVMDEAVDVDRFHLVAPESKSTAIQVLVRPVAGKARIQT